MSFLGFVTQKLSDSGANLLLEVTELTTLSVG